MPLSEKFTILDKLKSGESAAFVAREYGVNESTIRYIKKAEDKIRASVIAASPSSAKTSFVSRRDSLLEKMEKPLSMWVEDQVQQNAPLSGLGIRNQALCLYEHLKVESEGDNEVNSSTSFAASKGWLENFKKRFNLNNVKLDGGAAAADQEAAKEFLTEFEKVIEVKGYKPEQVFNADETGLFWKKMPNRTYISREECTAPGFKAAKDRVTLLLCGNAAGDFKCKPMLVYRAENPRALKGKTRSQLPVFWRSNKKAWVTGKLFKDWFENCFIHQVKSYLREKNLTFKVLLILDIAPGHPVSLLESHPNVEVIFFPPYTTSLLQPMDQGVIAIFKSYYTRRCFSHILEAIDTDPSATVRECWKSYNIRTAISVIKEAWDEINESTMNACWYKLWPEVVHDFEGFPSIHGEVSRIVELARNVGGEGFEDLQEEEVEDLFKCHQEELTNVELAEVLQSSERDPLIEEEDDIEPGQPQLTGKALREIFKLADQLKEKVMEIDPFMERSIIFKRSIDTVVAPYTEIYKDVKTKERQLQITAFLKPATSSSTPN